MAKCFVIYFSIRRFVGLGMKVRHFDQEYRFDVIAKGRSNHVASIARCVRRGYGASG